MRERKEQAAQPAAVSQPARPPQHEPAPEPELVPAAASGDAAVQNLIAAREIHDRNHDQDGVKAVDKALARLGYTV